MTDQGIPEDWSAAKASSLQQQSVPPGRVAPNVTPKPKWRRWSSNWIFWGALAGLISGGVGFIAVAMLLKLPAAPNCPSIFWPMASASLRLHCAQVAANKQTVDDLLRAITLVQALPKDHPWRQEIDRYVEQWSFDILALGDEKFQAGNLQEAVTIALKIPQNVPAHQAVQKRLKSWQSTWSEAEEIYQKAEAEIREEHWHQAFMVAVRLLNIENNYWTTTKYEELTNRIETTREDSNKLAKAQRIGQTGGLDNLLEAINLAETIGSNSYIYQKAQDALSEFGRKVLALAQERLDRRDVEEAMAIAQKIPASTGLKSEAEDFIALAEAWRGAWTGTVAGLQGAITQAQTIGSDRPMYYKAQELITRWQLEIESVTHLERARQLAQQGTIGDLKAAIAEAELIPDTNPRAEEAQQEINRWRGQVETIEDRPYLDRAEDIANAADVNSLQAAINEASQVGRGRALYQEAQSKIWTWTQQIQRIQDQPYLNRAEESARLGDVNSLQRAINEASQIGRGRALYQEAQSKIGSWTETIQRIEDQPYLDRAEESARLGDVNSLQRAIDDASQIGRGRALYREARRKIRTWTRTIQRIEDQPYLDQARALASSDNLEAAIAAAQQIQRGRALSKEAQALINDWQGQIQARLNWQQARQVALQGTPDSLAQAIRLADRVPKNSPLRINVNAAIAQWSQQMFTIARYKGEYDIPGGIAIARKIPRGTDAYRAAQRQIDIWQKFLNPEPPNTPEQPNTSDQQ